MKKALLLPLAMFMASIVAHGQGIDFRHITFKEALELAKKENKAIFIDVFTSWCGPCKALASEVFPLPEVGEAFNSRFISIKVDAEKSQDGKTIARLFGVTAYPTLLFVNGDSELVYRFLGYREPKAAVQEAEKAQAAFLAFPALKKFEARYRGGECSKEFLREYSDAMIASGMDCGKVLVDYFNLLPDSEVLDSVNVEMIKKLTLLDQRLTPRLIDMDILESSLQRMDRKQLSAFNKNIGVYLGNCLDAAAKQDSPEYFEQVLEYKKRYFTIKGNGNSIAVATLGGGKIYVPSEITAMEFYALKGLGEKFVIVYDGYLADLKKAYPDKKRVREALEKKFTEDMAAAEQSGDQKKIASLKSMNAMAGLFVGIDDFYAAVALIEQTANYRKFYAGARDKAFDDRIAANLVFLCDYYPSCKLSLEAAGKLLEMDRSQEARQVLEAGLEHGTKSFSVKDEDVEECRRMLASIR